MTKTKPTIQAPSPGVTRDIAPGVAAVRHVDGYVVNLGPALISIRNAIVDLGPHGQSVAAIEEIVRRHGFESYEDLKSLCGLFVSEHIGEVDDALTCQLLAALALEFVEPKRRELALWSVTPLVHQTLAILDNTVTQSGLHGILVQIGRNALLGAVDSTITQHLTVAGNQVTDSGRDGIHGLNVLTSGSTLVQDVSVSNNTVIHSDADGILVFTFGSNFAGLTQSLSLTGNMIASGPGGGIVGAGIGLFTSLASAPPAFQSVDINNNTMSNVAGAGGVGIYVSNALESASLDQTTLHINTNTITTAGGNGIVVANFVGVDSALTQGTGASSATIDSNVITSVGKDGIALYNQAIGGAGGSAVLSQALVIDSNTVTSAGRDGIYVRNGFSSASVLQAISIDHNTVTSSGDIGIAIFDGLSPIESSTVSQTFRITANDVTSSVNDGIHIDIYAGRDAIVSQTVSVVGNSVTQSDDDGIQIHTYVSSAAGFTQALIASTNDVTSTGLTLGGNGAGIALFSLFRDLANPATQSVQVNGNTVANVQADGIYVQTRVFSATVSQALQIDANTITSAGSFGISVGNSVSSGTLDQGVGTPATIDDNVISFATSGGITVGTVLQAGGVLNGTLSIDPIMIQHVFASGGFGIAVSIDASGAGAIGNQNLYIAGNTVTDIEGSHGGGIKVFNRADAGASIGQSLHIEGNTVTKISAPVSTPYGVGIAVYNSARGSTISQNLVVSHNVVTGDPSGLTDGIKLVNYVSGSVANPGLISQAISVDGNQVTDTRDDGIEIRDVAVGEDGVISQIGSVTSNNVTNTGTGANGINVGVYGRNLGFVTQGLNVDFNTVKRNNVGVNLVEGATDGFARVTWSMTGNTIQNNTLYGFSMKNIGVSSGNAIQFVELTGVGPANFINSNYVNVRASNLGGIQTLDLNGNQTAVKFNGGTFSAPGAGPNVVKPAGGITNYVHLYNIGGLQFFTP